MFRCWFSERAAQPSRRFYSLLICKVFESSSFVVSGIRVLGQRGVAEKAHIWGWCVWHADDERAMLCSIYLCRLRARRWCLSRVKWRVGGKGVGRCVRRPLCQSWNLIFICFEGGCAQICWRHIMCVCDCYGSVGRVMYIMMVANGIL